MVRDGPKNAMERADSQPPMRWNRKAVRCRLLRLQNNPSRGRVRRRVRGYSSRAESSSEREHFIAHKVKPNTARLGAIEVKSLNGFADLPAQLIPRIALRQNTFRETFGGKPAVYAIATKVGLLVRRFASGGTK